MLIVSAVAIGPGRLYNIGKIYSGLLHMFWIGALLPIITFLLRKKFPTSRFLNAVHWPIFFAGTGNLPPAVRNNVIRTLIVDHTDYDIDWYQLFHRVRRQSYL